ncbi:MAG: helix-turn-helix domain-containing protein [Pseudomonadota bacterium]
MAKRLFSERGFDAVTVRDLEVEAGVQRNLVSYHFGSKDELWKASASRLFGDLNEFNAARRDVMKDLPARERVAYMIRSYVRFAERCPELNRLMLHEGKQDSWRLRWIVDEYLRPGAQKMRALVDEELALSDDAFVHWYYLFVSGGAMMFSMAPEAKILFGIDLHDEEIVRRHADMMVDVLLSVAKR